MKLIFYEYRDRETNVRRNAVVRALSRTLHRLSQTILPVILAQCSEKYAKAHERSHEIQFIKFIYLFIHSVVIIFISIIVSKR